MHRLIIITGTLLFVGQLLRGQGKVQDVPLPKLESEYRIIPRLREPLGSVVTVQGVVVEGSSKGYEDGPNLRVQRINGRPIQDDIQIRIAPYYTDFGKPAVGKGQRLPRLAFGKTYEFEGYETGEFVGVPREAFKRAGVPLATSEFYFSHVYKVYKGKKIEAILLSPSEFVDREALIEGRAVSRDNKAYLVGENWQLLVNPESNWPKQVEEKTIEGLGIIRKTENPKIFRLEKGTTRLVKLQDQLGQTVELRGTAWSMNGEWWFNYRGIDMYVEGMKELPKWSSDLHGLPVLITGVLDQAMLPAIDQITLKEDRDLRKYFIVRKPSWKSIGGLTSAERGNR